MNRFALKKFTSFEESIALRKTNDTIHPEMDSTKAKMLHKGWIGTVKRYYFT